MNTFTVTAGIFTNYNLSCNNYCVRKKSILFDRETNHLYHSKETLAFILPVVFPFTYGNLPFLFPSFVCVTVKRFQNFIGMLPLPCIIFLSPLRN